MISFFRKKPSGPNDLSALSCDMHSHLIPGIDDGAKDMEDAIALITGLAQLGYKRLITTPHILSDYYPNTPDTILPGLQAVRQELKLRQIDVEINAAAEYMMDDTFVRMLENGDPLLTLSDKIVLVELSFAVPALNLKDILFQLQLAGYQPILAHPERYLYFGADKSWYEQLKDTGCLFQLNLLSIHGYYGKASLELAQYLIKKNYIDYLGTDLHHTRHLDTITNSGKIRDTVNRLLDTGLIRNASL